MFVRVFLGTNARRTEPGPRLGLVRSRLRLTESRLGVGTKAVHSADAIVLSGDARGQERPQSIESMASPPPPKPVPANSLRFLLSLSLSSSLSSLSARSLSRVRARAWRARVCLTLSPSFLSLAPPPIRSPGHVPRRTTHPQVRCPQPVNQLVSLTQLATPLPCTRSCAAVRP